MEYDTVVAAKRQEEFCINMKLPIFFPETGICWRCRNNIFSEDGFDIEYAKNTHITFCPFCHKSFLD